MSEVILNIPKYDQKDIRQLYDKYAGMLLGFIRGTVQDRKRSEEHLISIITAFSLETKGREVTWLKLRQYAQYKLKEFSTLNDWKANLDTASTNNYLNLLEDDERVVFQAVYYQGKSLAQLVDLLNQSESILRTQLKSSIDKIRKARGN